MGINEVFMAIILFGGIITAAAGINLYRYCVIAMSASGGFLLARMVVAKFAGVEGQGVFHDMDIGAGQSFIIALGVIVGAALGFFLFQIMGAVSAGIGAAFLFTTILSLLMGSDITTTLIGSVTGLFVGLLLGFVAVKYQGIWLIIFTALCGARMAGYGAASIWGSEPIASTLTKPLMGLYSGVAQADAVRLAFSLEVFVVVLILGVIIQSLIRND